MKIDLTILESDTEIIKKILFEIKKHLDSAFNKARQTIINDIKPLIKNLILSEPEYNSLKSGRLRYELGIPNPEIVDRIIDIWINDIHIINDPIRIASSQIIGGFSLNMIKSDYSDVLASDAAIIIDQNTGSMIPWLEWLLLKGGETLVYHYRVKMGPNPRSRSGMAIMVSSKENYRIPPQFAGTESNNWVYRAITRLDDRVIQSIVQSAIEKHI